MPPRDVAIALEADSAGVARHVLERLREYNVLHVGPSDSRSLVLGARDASGELIAGLVAETSRRWLHVEQLWVEEAHRRAGIGSALLVAAEDEARRSGCVHADLDTFDFQARPFYERHGYAVFGVLDDCPPGHQRFYLCKRLAPPLP